MIWSEEGEGEWAEEEREQIEREREGRKIGRWGMKGEGGAFGARGRAREKARSGCCAGCCARSRERAAFLRDGSVRARTRACVRVAGSARLFHWPQSVSPLLALSRSALAAKRGTKAVVRLVRRAKPREAHWRQAQIRPAFVGSPTRAAASTRLRPRRPQRRPSVRVAITTTGRAAPTCP